MMYHREEVAASNRISRDDDESRGDYDSIGGRHSFGSNSGSAGGGSKRSTGNGSTIENTSTASTTTGIQRSYGIELVLSPAPTTDSQRAKDCIVSTSTSAAPKGNQHYYHHHREHSEYDDETTQDDSYSQKYSDRSSLMGNVGRRKSRGMINSRTLEPLFDPDDDSEVSSKGYIRSSSSNNKNKNNSPGSILSSYSTAVIQPPNIGAATSNRKNDSGTTTTNDDPWRAAKRGDLASLKRFHSHGNIDWAEPDRFGNIPLYYACHSGAIVDIHVVHFLLWVTPIKKPAVLDQCKNRKNKEVMKILSDFEESGFRTNPAMMAEAAKGLQKPTRHNRSGSTNTREPGSILSDATSSTSFRPPRTPASSTGDGSCGSNSYRDSSLQSIVEDINQISVTPSTVTNMTIDGDDEWSMGSMFSFGKKRRQRRQNQIDATSQNSLESRQDARSNGSRGQRSNSSGGILSRKVSFDDKKTTGRKYGQLSFRRSPREKLRPPADGQSKDKTRGSPDSGSSGGSPNIEFDDQELQWKIQNHISTDDATQSNVVLTIHVSNARERVLIQNCHGVSIQIHGRKMKSMMICDCSDLNVVFDTVNNTCDVVHCKHVAIQTTGVCPTFAMERAKGVTVWLSAESMKVSNIVTSKCTEVNVSLPRGPDDNDYDRRELALPERYVHQFSGGEMKSRVSSVCR